MEKICFNTALFENPQLIKEAVTRFGSQSIIGSLEYTKDFWGKNAIYTHGGGKKTSYTLNNVFPYLEDLGIGELILNSIDRDGVMEGYDLKAIEQTAGALNIPVIACGGASSLEDFRKAANAGASAVAAGAMFVFHGRHRAVLITYPEYAKLREVFQENRN